MTAEKADMVGAVESSGGQAVSLFAVDPDSGMLQLQEETLEQVLLTDQLRDSLVIPVAITGAFRRGKSFLLNVLLRYLQSRLGSGGDWLAADGAPLTGFPWRGGRQAHTRDLQLWSQPLPVTLADGRPAHVLLIDSQGAFDDVSTPTESVAMRALAGLLSAVHVLNVSRQPQSDDLQQARLCAEYGRLLAAAASASSLTPRLVLLVRDWAFQEDQPYGADGGPSVLANWLAGGDIEDGRDCGDDGAGGDGDVGGSSDLAAEELECFLLPYPGAEAAGGGPQFSGAVSQLSEEFSEQLRQLAPWLLDSARLPLRKADGEPLTGASLAALCRSLAAHAGESPPELQAAADHLKASEARRAREAALQSYTARLQEATASEEPLSDNELQARHQEAETEACRVLKTYPGVDHLSEELTLRPLTAAIQEHWERTKVLNTERQQLRAVQADQHNAALAEAAQGVYEAAMQRALPADGPSLADACLRASHEAAQSSALQHFDSGREAAGTAVEQQRGTLKQQLEHQLSAQLARNGALRQQEAAAAAQQAVQQAQAQYQQRMAAAGELAEPALRQAHQAAAAEAQAAAGQAQLSGWLAAQLEQRLEAARQREKQELERRHAEAQAQLQAAQQAQAAAHRHRHHIRIGKAKIRFR